MMPVTDNSDELKPHQKPPETATISPEDRPALRNHWYGMQGATCDPFFENHHKMVAINGVIGGSKVLAATKSRGVT
jgi:hypothetical protein